MYLFLIPAFDGWVKGADYVTHLSFEGESDRKFIALAASCLQTNYLFAVINSFKQTTGIRMLNLRSFGCMHTVKFIALEKCLESVQKVFKGKNRVRNKQRL